MKGPNMNQYFIDQELESGLARIRLAVLDAGSPEQRFADVLDVIEVTLSRLRAIEAHPSNDRALRLVEEGRG
jgi:hypothetical protein